MQERFKCFSVKILDSYNVTVHSLVCNKLCVNEMHGATIKMKYDRLNSGLTDLFRFVETQLSGQVWCQQSVQNFLRNRIVGRL